MLRERRRARERYFCQGGTNHSGSGILKGGGVGGGWCRQVSDPSALREKIKRSISGKKAGPHGAFVCRGFNFQFAERK